jgi:transcriptional regulator with XRE-family HTH domain
MMIGPNLRKVRLKRGLTQEQLARLAGTYQSHIALIETGKVDVYLKTATRLACSLGTTVLELVNPEAFSKGTSEEKPSCSGRVCGSFEKTVPKTYLKMMNQH